MANRIEVDTWPSFCYDTVILPGGSSNRLPGSKHLFAQVFFCSLVNGINFFSLYSPTLARRSLFQQDPKWTFGLMYEPNRRSDRSGRWSRSDGAERTRRPGRTRGTVPSFGTTVRVHRSGRSGRTGLGLEPIKILAILRIAYSVSAKITQYATRNTFIETGWLTSDNVFCLMGMGLNVSIDRFADHGRHTFVRAPDHKFGLEPFQVG